MTSLALSRRYPQKRAFVTGAASGLGRALCHHLGADGWTVALADIDATGLQTTAEEVRRVGGHPHSVKLDVTDAPAFREAADAFVADAGGIDLVINNAGIGAGGAFADTSLEDWQRVLSVNLMGVVHGCRAFLPALRENGGHLMNVSSLAAAASGPYMAPYNVSKAGVQALSETLYGELREHDIHVCVLLPPFFATNIDENLRGSAAMQAMTQRLMERSGLNAETIARHALREAGRDRIHILYSDWTSRFVWYFRRAAPGRYVRTLPGRAEQVRSFVERRSASTG